MLKKVQNNLFMCISCVTSYVTSSLISVLRDRRLPFFCGCAFLVLFLYLIFTKSQIVHWYESRYAYAHIGGANENIGFDFVDYAIFGSIGVISMALYCRTQYKTTSDDKIFHVENMFWLIPLPTIRFHLFRNKIYVNYDILIEFVARYPSYHLEKKYFYIFLIILLLLKVIFSLYFYFKYKRYITSIYLYLFNEVCLICINYFGVVTIAVDNSLMHNCVYGIVIIQILTIIYFFLFDLLVYIFSINLTFLSRCFFVLINYYTSVILFIYLYYV